MNDRDVAFEKKVTETIAKEFGYKLTKSGKFYACKFCSKRFMLNYIGTPLNERMIEHYKNHLYKLDTKNN